MAMMMVMMDSMSVGSMRWRPVAKPEGKQMPRTPEHAPEPARKMRAGQSERLTDRLDPFGTGEVARDDGSGRPVSARAEGTKDRDAQKNGHAGEEASNT